jgi:hypothetical protein
MGTKSAHDVISLVGAGRWAVRLAEIRERMKTGAHSGRLALQRFAAEVAVERAARGEKLGASSTALAELASGIPALCESLNAAGRERLLEKLNTAMTADATLMPILHLLHTASLQQARGFTVSFTGLELATPFDLFITRDGAQAEIACDAISADDGRAVQRSGWSRLIDRIDPDLQTWLAAHPGRYLLKMTLPKGLRDEAENLPTLHSRINAMLAGARRADYDEAAILRLDPLLLAGAQAGDQPQGMMAKLRHEFGPEAQFSVTESGGSVFIMAARGGTENDVAATVRRRLAAISPARLTGTRPGILAMFVDDTELHEWRILNEKLLLEGEARQFLTFPEARSVIAVTFASRYELFNAGAPGGDLRYRNPMHPAAKSPALAPAVVSTV